MVVKSVRDGSCDEHDSADTRLLFRSADTQDNMLSLDLCLKFPQLDSMYTGSNQRRLAQMSSLLQRLLDTSFIWEIDQIVSYTFP